ncbi:MULTISPECIES: hypothetical protein [Halorubrum]|uniref:Uncharacterized protein n=1 Tax=Halorubrum persicum TaxID=1383844 RepID=A0A2G1WFD9_9EURY|nr:hypothetical protein [Halorubrum persicum]OYR85082.1 hypothetical protein DJ71_08055 [Halorubrum sp. E3]PHQ37714.1 hypothetical protein DJ69_15950 [Halorubrum persicum]
MTDQSVDIQDGGEGGGHRSTRGESADRSVAEREWVRRVWYRSRIGLVVIGVDLLLMVLLMGGTVVAYEVPFSELDRIAEGIVPPYVYAFSLFGALGFVFTALIEEFDSSTGDLLRYNFRLPAALPLGVGIYLLSGVILGNSASEFPLVAGTVFLAGLYVNLAYKRLGALARRLLPGRRKNG